MKDVIKWIPKKVKVAMVKPTPNNYKLKTALGKERLTKSLQLFGLAGTVVVNTDLSLIDGNSRLEQAKEQGEKEIWVSMPNRKLTPGEYKEMSAMYDFAKAGEVDMDRINSELGDKETFFQKWNLEVPQELLSKMGAQKSLNVEYKKGEPLEAPDKDVVIMVQLFLTEKQEAEFRKMEEKLKVKFKTQSTSELVMKVFKSIK